MRNFAKNRIIIPVNTNPAHQLSSKNLQETSSQNLEYARKSPVFLISVLGTVLEYFEYAIYGFLAPVLALHFFPGGDSTTALLKIFGVFAIGSLSKPLGALIFGYLGDVQGRRISLRYSMIGISFPTFIVGILPGYDTWGWVTTLLLVLCRMSQGIFIAGESDGVRIYVFEHFSSKYPCLMMSLVGCGAYLGITLASLVASQIPLGGEAWRFVFLGCSLFGVIVFFLRRYLIETPPFLAWQQNHSPPTPLSRIIKIHWRGILRTIMICGAAGGTYHFYLVFQGTYLSKILGLIPAFEGALYSLYLTSLYILIMPLAAWSADLWGLGRVGRMGGWATAMLILINTAAIMKDIVFFPLLLLTTTAMAFFVAPGYLYLMHQFDVGVRFRCLSLGHTIGSMLFSGTTPFVCLLLWKTTATAHAPFLYFLFLVLMGLIAFIWEKKTTQLPQQPVSLSS